MAFPIAALAAAGGVAHLVALGWTGGMGGVHAWVFGVMAVACLGCGGHLARTRCSRALLMAAGMAAVMVVVHLGYLLAAAPSFGGAGLAHGHGALIAGGPVPGGAHTALSPAMWLPLLPEFVVLALAGPVYRRSRTSAGS